MLIGVIADDFTGASDIAVTLSKGLPGEGGLSTTQYLGVPVQPARPEVEAGVIALKSRSLPAAVAVEQSLTACEWLLDQGCQQIVFKYCSTFDSTDKGNIGPVLDALTKRLKAKRVIVCPAFPAMGRTLYQGNLFVNDRPLNESGMEHHPVTPMKDADVRRLLSRQAETPVRHISWQQVVKGSESLRSALHADASEAAQLVVVDAISDHDLTIIGISAAQAPLISGGSGIAMALPHNFIQAGKAEGGVQDYPVVQGPTAILVGSCSGATRGQIEEHQKQYPVLALDIQDVMNGRVNADEVVAFICGHQESLPLVYSSGDPESVKQAQQQYGQENISQQLDALFGEAARKLVHEQGIQRLVVGGGETSGAVVSALNLHSLQVGEEIDPGVPALFHTASKPLALALKSGNFGRRDFFSHALRVLGGGD
ncbi:four-carbon acid sugar kinase family protein [Pantoea sp. EA-12]|uniref:3-oxo-tetronate kinase n=1 Tax=Pantoea sp. EA-12 TaxID=3043303 RepID=UPI0024B4FB74|nr:3-oxo-tetronate kinase [Pantoea sp. EA-12]MDI9221570.1 four-carbon acid sugar kinase family protein [Pantoea sp. EA-12]